MSRTFTKLFSSITESTVWCEPDQTRLVWITMLAMADRHGRVWASIPGLANRARVSVEATAAAIVTFLAPDRYSRTADYEGRRIEPIDGGWKLLNHEKYREIRDEENTKESKREWARRNRAAKAKTGNDRKKVDQADLLASTIEHDRPPSNGVDAGRDNAEADANTDKKKKKLCLIPADFYISDNVRKWAEVAGHTMLEKRLEHFRDWAIAASKQYADWDATFRNAIRGDWAHLNGAQGSIRPASNGAAHDGVIAGDDADYVDPEYAAKMRAAGAPGF